jgi:hypothetical protein
MTLIHIVAPFKTNTFASSIVTHFVLATMDFDHQSIEWIVFALSRAAHLHCLRMPRARPQELLPLIPGTNQLSMKYLMTIVHRPSDANVRSLC